MLSSNNTFLWVLWLFCLMTFDSSYAGNREGISRFSRCAQEKRDRNVSSSSFPIHHRNKPHRSWISSNNWARCSTFQLPSWRNVLSCTSGAEAIYWEIKDSQSCFPAYIPKKLFKQRELRKVHFLQFRQSFTHRWYTRFWPKSQPLNASRV